MTCDNPPPQVLNTEQAWIIGSALATIAVSVAGLTAAYVVRTVKTWWSWEK